MDWWLDILKYKYFSKSEDRLKGVLLSLLILLAILILTIDIYGSIAGKYTLMVFTESVVITILLALYFLFPHTISLQTASFVVVGFLTLVIVASLTIPGYNQEFVLFAAAIIPSILFFFLGTRMGIRWNVVIIILLTMTTLNAYFQWVAPVFTGELLAQVTIAYIIFSYFHYAIEKQRSGYERELAAALRTKDVLLKEVHHRAKNNLQTIMGILESQAMREENAACQKVLTSQRNRLKAMSLVHESFTRSPKSERVDLKVYLQDIANNIQIYTHHTIVMDLESQMLSVSDAVNLGLFFNEALSNAIEHAYSQNEQGRIEISLKCPEEYCTLRVKDFGKGFDVGKRRNSLGLVLMEDISNFFHDGNMMIDHKNGTEIILSFNAAKHTFHEEDY